MSLILALQPHEDLSSLTKVSTWALSRQSTELTTAPQNSPVFIKESSRHQHKLIHPRGRQTPTPLKNSLSQAKEIANFCKAGHVLTACILGKERQEGVFFPFLIGEQEDWP